VTLKSFRTLTMADMFEDILRLDEKNASDMTPEQYARHRETQEAGKKFHEENPVHHMNIVNHFNQATEDERTAGENWYSDASHLNKVLAHDAGVHPHVMAGLIANYSPQTHWATNMMTASRVARTKQPLGGKGGGVFASANQAKAAKRLLDGESHQDVLSGHKIKAFAHLVEHGHQTDPENPKVVVDRHAHSVASGKRLTDVAFNVAGLSSKKKYNQLSKVYNDAAAHLSEAHGRKIEPHQVQAVTWLVRQRLNAQEEHSSKGSSKTAKVSAAETQKWNQYAGEHHPTVVGKEPGTGWA
jgi:hypothetical protein